MKILLNCVVVLFVCMFFVLPVSISAQEEGKTVTLEEVVVTATKIPEKRKDIPNAVIIMDETDIQASAAKTVGEVLANELGIDLRTYGNYGGASQEIHFRGMGGDGTQVFVNGVNVNSPSLGVADVAQIPLNSIERIEVVKGSGSLLYGSGAMGGTINIVTKRPKRDKMDLKATAGYGTQNTYQLTAEQGMFLAGDFGYYVTAGRKETDGFRDNSDLTHNDVSLKLVYDKGKALDISLYGDYIDRSYGRPGVKPPAGTGNFNFGGEKVYNGDSASLLDKGGDKDGHVVFQVKSDPLKWLGLNFKGDYTHMKNYNYMRYYDSWTGGLPGQETWTTNEVTGVEGNLELRPFIGANLLIGAEYKDYVWKNENVKLDNNGNQRFDTRSKTKAHLYTKGTFAEAQWRPSKYFKVLAGLRHEDHSTFGYEDLPRFGLVVNPLEKTVLKLSHGKHYKAPSPNDLFWPYEDWGWGMGAEGNRNLKPETGWHTDATLEQTFLDDKVFFTLTYFKWDIKDKIMWVPDSSYFYMPQNLASYEADGWEVGTKIGPFYSMIVTFDYTYTNAEENKKGGAKRQARYTPDRLFKGALTWWTEFGLSTTATVRYVGDRPGYYTSDTDVNPSKTLDSYWTVDLKIKQRVYDHWIVTLTGNNLFDKGYETYAAHFYDSTGTSTLCGYPGVGRSIFASVGYEF